MNTMLPLNVMQDEMKIFACSYVQIPPLYRGITLEGICSLGSKVFPLRVNSVYKKFCHPLDMGD